VLSAATMTLGNLLAMVQMNFKHLIAYSSAAHAGYALIGLVTLTPVGLAAAFYLLTYLLANLAAFAVVTLVAGAGEGEDVAALAMLGALLSLAGMPPFGGFVAKLNSILTLYY
jgi:NADH-quinone oxidoreductase subunit N